MPAGRSDSGHSTPAWRGSAPPFRASRLAPSGAATRASVLGPLAAALATFALHAACGGRYGPFRDEMYFVVCGERLAWGYVDQPPLVAVVARAAHELFGAWVPGWRLLPWIASAATAWLAGRLASRLGGGPFAAILAAVATAASPLLLGLGHYLTMNAFEPLLWTALALTLARLASGGDGRLWLAAGALVGLGLLDKYSMAYFAACLGLGLLLVPERRLLLDRRLALGALFAALLTLPNLAWQAGHGFPFLELARRGQLYKNTPFELPGFFLSLFLEAGPLGAPVWLGGLAWLGGARASRPFRLLGLGALLLLAFLVAARGKPYYAAPLLPALFAAGGVAWEGLLRPRWSRLAAPALVAAGGLAFAPAAIPLLPVEDFVRWQAAVGFRQRPLERAALGVLPQVFADQFGWPELASGVAGAFARLPAAERERAVVFAQNYGEAAALDLYGRPLGLPPAASGHNQYFLWGPPEGRGEVAVVVSGEREDCGRGTFRRRELLARLPENPWAMPYESGRWIWICREPMVPVSELWPRLRHYE
ncbi:MAG TPA: glycosyltransferase family 39 protein [Anaeromyxobacteraceae bacterium]|nr:glycosyltransferase family 39 protein [Anaeromyxobacteraceae bacterium]